jgi:hypothetical protein
MRLRGFPGRTRPHLLRIVFAEVACSPDDPLGRIPFPLLKDGLLWRRLQAARVCVPERLLEIIGKLRSNLTVPTVANVCLAVCPARLRVEKEERDARCCQKACEESIAFRDEKRSKA